MSRSISALAGLGPDDGGQRAQVLIIGSGGRAHALAWKLAQSPHVSRIFVAPGNGGTQHHREHDRIHNVAIPVDDHQALVTFAQLKDIALTIVGPERPLADGIVDRFAAAGLACFGPRRVSAQLEASKAFAKAFMQRHGIPTARSKLFEALEPAQAYVRELAGPCVVKASGLAAGKGVAVCADVDEALTALQHIMADRVFGEAGAAVLIEERLEGEEASMLAFCDGKIAVAMPAAQDHKGLLAGGAGPNTGGMGAYAPAPVITPEHAAFVQREVFDRAMAGMRQEAYPYVGVLYAGLMITADGPRVLEFNCRFGDPETQALLPLLASDLFEVIQACVAGDLAPGMVRWRRGAAAAVVAASAGYPGPSETGLPIDGITLAQHAEDTWVFHAGTRWQDERWRTSGGRVLAVTGYGEHLRQALDRAYAGIHRIGFDGKHVRDDIGWRALQRLTSEPTTDQDSGAEHPNSQAFHNVLPADSSPKYTAAGVDLSAAAQATALMADAVRATHGPAVVGGFGGFAGGLDLGEALARSAEAAGASEPVRAPVLVASTDGVGTKASLAIALEQLDGLGADVVHHCVNDVLTQGARPLFFLDYLGSARLDPSQAATLVASIGKACAEVGCALLGGETAAMPQVYQPGTIDVVGTLVGVVDRDGRVDGGAIEAGDVVLGLASNGLHTNGYSLAQRVFAQQDLRAPRSDLGGVSLGDALLAPHRHYLAEVSALQAAGVALRGLSHITGGGLCDNPGRMLPVGLGLTLAAGSWPEPAIFGLMRDLGRISEPEMRRVFNLGLGMLVVVSAAQADAAEAALAELSGGARCFRVGRVTPWQEGPRVRWRPAGEPEPAL